MGDLANVPKSPKVAPGGGLFTTQQSQQTQVLRQSSFESNQLSRLKEELERAKQEIETKDQSLAKKDAELKKMQELVTSLKNTMVSCFQTEMSAPKVIKCANCLQKSQAAEKLKKDET